MTSLRKRNCVIQVPNGTGLGVQRSERWHVTPVPNVLMKLLEKSRTVIRSRFCIKSDRWRVPLYIVRLQNFMYTCNSDEKELHNVQWDPRIDHRTFSMTISSVHWRIPVREAFWKFCVSLKIKHPYEEQARAYCIRWDIKIQNMLQHCFSGTECLWYRTLKSPRLSL